MCCLAAMNYCFHPYRLALWEPLEAPTIMPLPYIIINAYLQSRLDEAREKQLKAVQMIEVLIRCGGGVTAGKAMMKMAGVDCGVCRSPLKTVGDEQYKAMEKELKAVGFFEYCIKTK